MKEIIYKFLTLDFVIMKEHYNVGLVFFFIYCVIFTISIYKLFSLTARLISNNLEGTIWEELFEESDVKQVRETERYIKQSEDFRNGKSYGPLPTITKKEIIQTNIVKIIRWIFKLNYRAVLIGIVLIGPIWIYQNTHKLPKEISESVIVTIKELKEFADKIE